MLTVADGEAVPQVTLSASGRVKVARASPTITPLRRLKGCGAPRI